MVFNPRATLLIILCISSSSSASGDLLGLSTPPSQTGQGNTGVLLDVLGDIYGGKSAPATTNNTAPQYNPKK